MIEKLVSRQFMSRVGLFTVMYSIWGVLFPISSLTTTYVVGTIVTGVLYALLLGGICSQMSVSRPIRISVLWLALYVIQWFNNMIEAFFFTTQFEDTSLVASLVAGLILPLPYVLIAGVLFPPNDAVSSLKTEFRDYFAQNAKISWLGRILAASTSWVPIYLTFGMLVSNMVLPFYTDPNMNYGVNLPGYEIIIPLQFLRGFLYIMALLPILILLKVDLKQLWIILVALLYIPGTVAFFLLSETFPVVLRVVHGMELLADAIVHGGIIVYLLGRRSTQHIFMSSAENHVLESTYPQGHSQWEG